MYRFTADRIPVTAILLLSLLDFYVFFTVDNVWWLASYAVLSVIPKGIISAWNHHHQHSMTFHSAALNRILEFFYALHTGVTTNLWVLHHVHGHHRNYLDQTIDESRWMRRDGGTMNPLEYTLSVAGTAYYRGFQVGKNYPRLQRDFVVYTLLTFAIVTLLCVYRFVPALIIFVVPMIVSIHFTAWVTHDHHAGLDSDNVFEASYNNTNRVFNFFTGNLGYHTAHHYRGGLHWSKLPELHEKIKDKIPPELFRDSKFVLADA